MLLREHGVTLFASPNVGGKVVVVLFVYAFCSLCLRGAIDYVDLERVHQGGAGRRTLLRGWPFVPGCFLTAGGFLARQSFLLVLLAPANVFGEHRRMLSPEGFADNCVAIAPHDQRFLQWRKEDRYLLPGRRATTRSPVPDSHALRRFSRRASTYALASAKLPNTRRPFSTWHEQQQATRL